MDDPTLTIEPLGPHHDCASFHCGEPTLDNYIRKPSEAFARHFGERHGVELPTPPRLGYRPLAFAEEDSE